MGLPIFWAKSDMGTTGKTPLSVDNWACECVHVHQGGEKSLEQLHGRNVLNGCSHVCVEVFRLRAVTEFMSGREKGAERLPKCMSETDEERGIVGV